MPNQNLVEAATYLANIDNDWQQLIQTVGPCDLEPAQHQSPYQALSRAVAHQQLHGKAGDAILNRLLQQFSGEFPTPQQLLALPFDNLRACGFSGRKIETLTGIANATLAGVVPDRQIAETLTDDELIARLITLKGIGRWTVEMLLIFSLGRLDVLPADDFGVCEGYKRFKKLDKAPKAKEMTAIGLAWQPYRSVASWYLWRTPKIPAKK